LGIDSFIQICQLAPRFHSAQGFAIDTPQFCLLLLREDNVRVDHLDQQKTNLFVGETLVNNLEHPVIDAGFYESKEIPGHIGW